MTERQAQGPSSTDRSRRLHEEALECYPGGVSHNVRYEPPHPLYVDHVEGPHVVDVDGNEYVDFWNDHHASLLGHAHPDVVEAVTEQVSRGLHYGNPHEDLLAFGRKIREYVPTAERLRLCVSGTEATMYAVRLARASTGNDHVLKVEAGWHGGNTDLSVAVYPPFDAPTTAGLPPGAAEHVHAFELNDEDAVRELLDEHDVAAVILDPRKSGTPPDDAFLEFLADQRDRRGFQLIFDEIVTGVRVAPGSYQARVGVDPDLTAIGKCFGGGMAFGALAGRADLFEPARPDVAVDPHERVIAGGGTFSANPMTVTAGLATLRVVDEEPVHEHTERLGERLRTGLADVFADAGADGGVLGFSSLVLPIFNAEGEVATPTDVKTKVDFGAVRAFHTGLMDRGYYFLPGHMGNVSYQTTEEHVDGVVEAAQDVVADLLAEGVVDEEGST